MVVFFYVDEISYFFHIMKFLNLLWYRRVQSLLQSYNIYYVFQSVCVQLLNFSLKKDFE